MYFSIFSFFHIFHRLLLFYCRRVGGWAYCKDVTMIYYCVEVEEKSKHYELRITMVDGMHTVSIFFKKSTNFSAH